MKPLRLLTIINFLFFLSGKLAAQNCIPTNINGAIINFACNQPCPGLSFQIPHIKSSDDYTVVSAPYLPYAFKTPTGNELTETYIDDQFSHLKSLPFPVCFYGSLFNNFVVGSNGVITFDASQADCRNDWRLDFTQGVGQPVPYVGPGTCSETNVRKYPPLSIMGPYQDLNPNITATSPDRKIEWRVEGITPCRKLIVSFYQVVLYGDHNQLNTYQIVVHESTGLIDIFIETKKLDLTPGNPWNSDFAILGLQKDASKAITAPGKNCTVWREDSTGYRFVPSAGGSRYVISQLYTMSGALVATADTTTTTPGLLNLNFLNTCFPTGSTNYVVKTTFSACDNPATQLISYDTITVNRASTLNATATTTNTNCGPPTGTITVTVPVGAGTPPYTYVLDGGTPVVGPSPHTFTNVAQGMHNIVVTEAVSSCTSVLNEMVFRNNSLTANTSTTPTACAAVATGSITITPTNGTGPYTFQLDGFLPVPGAVPFTFNNVSGGNHNVIVTDATGCQTNVIVVNVPTGPGVTGTTSSTIASCVGVANATLTATVLTGIAPFTWQLDGGAPQIGPSPHVFINVSSGPHSVTITDNIGCSNIINENVTAGPGVLGNAVSTPVSCQAANNGTITATATLGAAPFTWQLDGGAFQNGTNPYTFTNVGGGTHFVTIKDNVGCTLDLTVNITSGNGPTASATSSPSACNGANNGTITVTAVSGAAPYTFSLDGATPVPGSNPFTFINVSPGSHTVVVTDAAACVSNMVSITVTEPVVLVATTALTAVRCHGENNGIINVTPSGGVSPYRFSIDGGVTWQSNNIFNVPAGNYTIIIKDFNNCTTTKNITVTEPAILTASSTNSNASCDGGNDGRINVSANGGNAGYSYSIDGINFQSSGTFNVAPGNYTVTVKDGLGCTTSFNVSVGLTVNLFLNPPADITICEGTSAQLQLTTNATSYSWTPATGLSNTGISNPVANPTVTTKYFINVVLGRCSTSDSMIVHVNPAPVADAGPDGNICYGESDTLQGSGGVQYQWSPPIYLNTASVANPIATPNITTAYALSVIDALGCRSLIADEAIVVVSKPIRVYTFPFDTVGYPGDRFQLQAISSGISYSWSPAGGLSNTNIPNPLVTLGAVGADIIYQVIATGADGCTGKGYVKIKVSKGPDIYVPTGFTPDHDGKNDQFTPIPVGIKSYNYFRIFNRWGQIVFSTNKQNEGWNGTLGGKEQPEGIYVWMIEGVTKDNRLISKKGTVILIR